MVSITGRPTAPYTKTPGTEPIPGYVLIEPLGRGGFGEVWKCQTPDGLHKTVKFVTGSRGENADKALLQQEYEALQQVKAIQHPYLLGLERVELVGHELVMVMTLADRHLGDRFEECRQAGLPGIPRRELLGYLKEAAEALDAIGTQHGLQHLAVKPTNLFLTAGHVQVGDYGLVSKLDGGASNEKNRGLSPKYSAPEVLHGRANPRSDQYSLALVYQELLTGTFPFTASTPQQVILQHTSAAPDLNGLSTRDAAAVAAALAKKPEGRFVSCVGFITALTSFGPRRLSLVTPQSKNSQTSGDTSRIISSPAPRQQEPQAANSPKRDPNGEDETAQHNSLSEISSPTVSRNPTPQNYPQPTRACGVRVPKVLSVLPVSWLRGREAPEPELQPTAMVRAILAAAKAAAKPGEPEGIMQHSDGTWSCRFLSTIDPRVAKVKLCVLWEQGKFTLDAREESRVIIRQLAPPPSSTRLFQFGKKPAPSGVEVVVELPEPGGAIGEVFAHGEVFGSPPPDFADSADQTILSLLEGVQRELNNFQERRKHPRIPASFPVVVYPIHHDGRVEAPLNGRCQDVSAGGLALRLNAAPTTRYACVAFEGVRGTTGLALLFQIIRTTRETDGVLVTGRYRLEFWRDEQE
jgi:serine/threonine protein kinase